jgi:signal transduction histidine kinase
MRLPEFIAEKTEAILVEFEEFARTHTTAGDTMDIAALRDHAAGMLVAIARDVSEHQSDEEQEIKSKGDAPESGDEAPTAAEKHGTDRAVSGFTLDEMFSEYRALRGSVLRLWTDAAERQLDEQDVDDLIRFNEAIDQSLAESITRFATGLDRAREMFIAILGHDLRSPLGAVLTASEFLETEAGLEDANLTMAKRIHSSAERMRKLIADLLDFTSARLGRGIPIDREAADIAAIARETLAELGGQYPDRELRLEAAGDTGGEWDAQRLSQALSNLIGNAGQHGAAGTPITVDVTGSDDQVVVSVHNLGPVIPADDIGRIFDPFSRLATGEAQDKISGSIGLGLYIAQQIALAHGGSIKVRSSAEVGTTFLLQLPRAG